MIIPKHSRNPYDLGVRMVGAEIVEVETPEEMRAKISPRTAMIYVMSTPRAEKGPLNIPAIIAIAKKRRRSGSGGCGGGRAAQSQSASVARRHPGLLFRRQVPARTAILRHAAGRQALCKAAYYQAAPHHAYGRALKCSKEETMGLLAAVTQWYKRDHAAEQKMWLRLDAEYRERG